MMNASPIHSSPTPSHRPRIITAAKWLLAVAVIAFVGWELYRRLAAIAWGDLELRALPTLAAAAAIFGIFLMQMLSYRSLLAACFGAPSLLAMLPAAWVPQLGKYLPGKVASVAGAVWILRRWNIPGPVALSVVLLLEGLVVITGLMAAALLLWQFPQVQQHLRLGWLWFAIILAAGMIFLHPAIYGAAANFILRRLGRPPLPRLPTLRGYIRPLLWIIAQWICAGLALWFTARALGHPVPPAQIPLFISISALAMTAGYLAIFAPAGLGVREGIFLIALTPLIGPADAALAALLMRAIQIVVELLLAALGLLILRHFQKHQPDMVIPARS